MPAPLSHSVNTPLPVLASLRALVSDDLSRVNDLILEIGGSRVELILNMADHIISSGGKRLRPILTLASAQLCNYEGDRHIDLAAAVEFMHTATLLHDDVVDESLLRRGMETANNLWGNKASVLVGDFLLGQAFQLMVRSESLRVLEILSHAAAVIAEGEVKQLEAANSLKTDFPLYLDIITSKTATLFAAACEISPVMAKRPKVEQEALHQFGLNLGIAFQIADDALDYSATQERLGKTIGDDFREGKVTLPVLIASERASSSVERVFWQRVIEERNQRGGDLEQAIRYMQNTGALDAAMETAETYVAKGREALGIFPESEMKNALLHLLDFVVDRPY